MVVAGKIHTLVHTARPRGFPYYVWCFCRHSALLFEAVTAAAVTIVEERIVAPARFPSVSHWGFKRPKVRRSTMKVLFIYFTPHVRYYVCTESPQVEYYNRDLIFLTPFPVPGRFDDRRGERDRGGLATPRGTQSKAVVIVGLNRGSESCIRASLFKMKIDKPMIMMMSMSMMTTTMTMTMAMAMTLTTTLKTRTTTTTTTMTTTTTRRRRMRRRRKRRQG